MPLPIETLTLFVAASAALAVAPGPDNIFVVAQSMLYGRAAGLFVTLGLCTGLLFHTAAVATGVAAIFAASELAFTVLKLVGGAYLLYLAWRAFRAGAVSVSTGESAATPVRRLYLRGVIMNLTNPKVAIFFLAFLPQFTDPLRGSVTLQTVFLGAAFIAVTLVVFGAFAWFSGSLGARFAKSPHAQLWLNRLAGLVFLGLAVRLVTATR